MNSSNTYFVRFLSVNPSVYIPIRNLGKFSVPKFSIIDLRPLCPPLPPDFLIRILPNSRLMSSHMTIISSGAILFSSARGPMSVPDRFIYVWGSRRIIFSPLNSPCPRIEERRIKEREAGLSLMDKSFAILSIARNPTLWRVLRYLRPGFPRPVMSLTTSYLLSSVWALPWAPLRALLLLRTPASSRVSFPALQGLRPALRGLSLPWAA